MRRIEIELSKLKPNPFKKLINGGELNVAKVERLKESVGQHGFWDGLVCRASGDAYQIAFGHHRVAAAKDVLGRDYKTSILIDEFDDTEMLRMLANENSSSEGASEFEQIDTAVATRNWLIAHPEACKSILVSAETSIKGSEKKHVHGSVSCISEFLGRYNWPRVKVHRFLGSKNLIQEAREMLFNQTDTIQKIRPGHLSISSGPSVAKLEKPVQRALVHAIKSSRVAIPSSVVNEAVKVIEEVKPERRVDAAIAAVRAAEAKIQKDKEIRNSKDIDDVASRMSGSMVGYIFPFSEEDRDEFLRLREFAKPSSVHALASSLRRAAKKFTDYADAIEAPAQKKLRGGERCA